tara:strand:+ start:6331 stop:9333 length:3003 start_codon:yes stop_codon:yes gene_type:complete
MFDSVFSGIKKAFLGSALGSAVAKFVPFLSPILSFISIVSTALTWLRKPDEPEFNFDTTAENIAKGILVNKTSANGQIPIVYGTRKVGGIISFLETSGTDNEYLYMIFTLCEGEIDDISQIYINENLVTWSGDLADNTERTVNSSDSNYYKGSESLISVKPHYGSDSQTYDTLVGSLTSWTSNHRLRGVAYLALKFKWNQDAFGGIPSVHAVVKGKKIYNPNLDGTLTGGSGSHRADTSSTWEYSDNPVYQLLDYLRNTRYGMGIANGYFDSNFADWQTAGDVCDANITPYSGADQIDLIDSHAVVDTSKKCIENVKDFLTGCRGYLNYTAGEYKVLVETSGSASITLTEDNIIGGIGVSSKNKNERYNRVIVTFINPNKNYQVDEAQFPPVDDSAQASADQHSTMKTADGGILLEGRFDFPSITSPYQAQEMAEIILRRSRSSLDVSLTADANAMELAVGDIVNVTHATPSFSAKPFRVLSVTLNPDSTVSLQLTEHQDSYYTFGTQTAVATIPDTTLPNPFSVSAPASVTLTDELILYNEGTAITRLNIVVGASTDKFVQYYQVEAKLSTETDYKIIAKGSQLNYEMLNVIDDKTYNVRVKAINALGVSSSYTSANRLIVGATEPPNDVENFSVNMQGSNQMQLNWDAVSDLDVSYYEIRYQNVTSSAQWNKSNNWLQVPRTSGTTKTTNAKTGAFLIKAVDKLGNESNNETIIYSNISSLQSYKNISTLTEDLTLGTYDGDVALTDSSGTNSIVLDTITDFDDTVGNFDSPSGDFDLGGTDVTSNPNYYTANIDNEGFYTLNSSLSLSGIFDVSFTKNLTIDQIEDPYDLFDSGRGFSNFDDAPAPFDGNDPTNAIQSLQVASSTSSLGDATNFFALNASTTYKGRYFKFRLRMANKNNKVRGFVSGISVSVDMEKRIESDNDVASTTGTKAITYTNSFYASPAVGISAQNMATGDTYTISSKSATGFSIAFTNSSGSGINRTFDYVAQGYGLKSSS